MYFLLLANMGPECLFYDKARESVVRSTVSVMQIYMPILKPPLIGWGLEKKKKTHLNF